MANKPKLKVVAKKSATADKSAFKGKPKASPKAAMQELLASVSMGELAEANMKEYGTYTIEDRAINCLYDGSKPVVRRVLYAMYGLGLTNSHNYVKAARPVSEAMGKYHPHGDSSIYGAMVRQSNGNGPVVPLVDGQGNWGDYEGKQPTYGAAAYRYTECRLTEFATKYMVAKEYMDERVIPYVPNYDGTEREPIYLPSLLPMAFVNGTFGIAMGVSCHMPAYSLESVVSAISTLFKTKNAKKAARKLVPISRWGAKCLVTQEGLDDYHNTGLGKFVWKAQYTIKETKTGWLVSVTGMPIGNNIGYEALFFGGKDSGEGRKTEKGIANIAGVYRVENLSSRDGLLIEIDCRTEEALDKVEKRLTINESYRAMTTLRKRHPTDPERTLTTFLATSPVHMLELWLEWRISLERSLLSSLIENNEAEIKRLNLLIIAASNLDKLVVIIKAKSGDKVAMIAKSLKVSVEDARVIWGLTVSRLDAVNIVATKERITALQREIKTYKTEHKDPTLRLVNGLAALSSAKGLERALTKNSNVKAKK